MSYYGKHITIDGIPCGLLLRGVVNGEYQAVFEREYAGLEEIEAINWARPAVCCERACDNILPEGYGFRVRGITYDSGARAFTVTFQVMEQYLGDVTGYQAQVEAARAETEQVRQEAQAAEEAALAETERLRREMEALEAQAAEADETIITLYESMAAEQSPAEEEEAE